MNFLKRVAAKLPFSFQREKTTDERKREYLEKMEEAKQLLGITPEINALINSIKFNDDIEKGVIRYLGLNQEDFDFIRGLSTKNLDVGWMEANDYYRINRPAWRKYLMKDSPHIVARMNLTIRDIATKPEDEDSVELYAKLIYLASVMIKRINFILPEREQGQEAKISG